MKILIIILVIALSGTTALAAERPNRDGLGKDLDYSDLGDTNYIELDSPSDLVDESSSNVEDLETKTLTAYGEPNRGSNSSKGGGTR